MVAFRTWLACLALGSATVPPVNVAPAVAKPPHPAQSIYAGTLDYEADFRRPGETRSFGSEERFYRSADGEVRLDWTTWGANDTTRVPETFLVRGDSVFHRDSPDARWVLLAGRAAHEGLLQACAGFPSEVWRPARGHKVVTRDELIGKVGRQVGRPDQFVETWAHPRLGDTRDSIVYYWGTGDAAPESLHLSLHRRDDQWRMRGRLVSWSGQAPAESLFRKPDDFDRPQGDPDSLVEEPKIGAIAPGIWSAEMEDIGSRTLIVEFADYLAMIAEGATVVTTPGNEALVRRMAALPFTIEPDRLARSPRPLEIRRWIGRFELADSTNRLVAPDYGRRSEHTDEFVVFWFPRAKLLFEASLGWARGPDGKPRVSSRMAPLLAWLDERKADVRRVVQSWPMRGVPPELSRAELDSMIQAAKR